MIKSLKGDFLRVAFETRQAPRITGPIYDISL
jgi:hypothetical protein